MPLQPFVTLVGETGSVPSTSFFTTDCADHLYAIWGDVAVTSPGTSGTVLVSVTYTNAMLASGSSTLNSQPISLTTLAEQGFLLGVLHSAPNQPVEYSTTVTGSAGSPVYTLRLRVQCLG